MRSEPVAQGSSWNTNSYHWEEKPKTNWCDERIRAVFPENSEIQADMGKVLLQHVSIKGTASITVRKAKHIRVFEYTIGFNVSIDGGEQAAMKVTNHCNDDDELDWNFSGGSFTADQKKKLKEFFACRFKEQFLNEWEELV